MRFVDDSTLDLDGPYILALELGSGSVFAIRALHKIFSIHSMGV